MSRLLRFGSFEGVLALGLVLGGLGFAVAVALCVGVLIPLASACLQACAANPALMTIARGAASLSVAVVGSGVMVGLLALTNQLMATRRLVARVEYWVVEPPQELARLALDLGLSGRLTYVDDPGVYAFCHGFLSPRICISSGMVESLGPEELQAVLLHEGYHLRQRDPLRVLASRVVAGALFLLPLAADLRDRYLVEKELAADAHVVRRLSARPLAGALLKICGGAGQRPVADLAAAAVGSFNEVGERIHHLAHPNAGRASVPGRKVAVSLVAVMLVLAASVGSAFAAEHSMPTGRTCCSNAAFCPTTAGGGQVGQ